MIRNKSTWAHDNAVDNATSDHLTAIASEQPAVLTARGGDDKRAWIDWSGHLRLTASNPSIRNLYRVTGRIFRIGELNATYAMNDTELQSSAFFGVPEGLDVGNAENQFDGCAAPLRQSRFVQRNRTAARGSG